MSKVGKRKANPKARPRRSARSRRERRITRRQIAFGSVLGSALLVAVSLVLLWRSGWIERQAEAVGKAAWQATADLGLSVADVQVEGRNRTAVAEILGALRIARGMPILKIDPSRARADLEALPWVHRAEVERRLPGLVYVRLEERDPMALWQLDGKLSVVDREGVVIPGAEAAQFAELPLLVGAGAPVHGAELIAMLRTQPDIMEKVTAAVRVGERRWNLQIDGKIDVRLPEEETAAAWREFARLVREESLLGRDVIAIDLRLPDRLILRTSPGSAPGDAARQLGQET